VPRVALVVDDSMLIRHTVCRFLQERGFAAEGASNGAEALEIMKTMLPDLINTDLNMPMMDGNEFIARLKASSRTARIPIVVLRASHARDTDEADPRVDASVFKDVEIVAELEKALAVVMSKPSESHATVRAS
jgi:CheY-like chemotaxis protein